MVRAKKGDTVKCLVHDYLCYGYGQKAHVLDVAKSATGSTIIKLSNAESPLGYSWYLAENFEFIEREHKMPAYEKTQYFAARLDSSKESGHFLHLDPEGLTCMRYSKHIAMQDVKELIQEGEQWVILQTVMKLTGESPKPPVSIVEYK